MRTFFAVGLLLATIAGRQSAPHGYHTAAQSFHQARDYHPHK